MITIFVTDFNTFNQEFYDNLLSSIPFHQLICPVCGQSSCMTIHAYYIRYIITDEGKIPIKVCRVICSECHSTHAILPSSAVPYTQITLSDTCDIIQAFDKGDTTGKSCRTGDGIDENNFKSVVRRYCKYWRERIRSEFINLFPLADLVSNCFTYFNRQFMQIHRTRNKLFHLPT